LEPPPSQWAWHYRTLLQLRERLLRAHTEHAAEVAAPAEMRGVDVADTAQEQLDRDVLWAELGAQDDQLFEVDCALQRIRDGVYGVCEETGHAIPAPRLRAIPWTRYSRDVAARHEHRRPSA
jgi:RNA polymerase-binding transcription factor DksA